MTAFFVTSLMIPAYCSSPESLKQSHLQTFVKHRFLLKNGIT